MMECGGNDCDDADDDRRPGNPERCDALGHDEDCNLATLAGDSDGDLDGDGYTSAMCCNGSACGDDCDDGLREIFPGAREQCNAVDDDCDGSVDEGDAFCPVGRCIERRCDDDGWERVYGTAGGDGPFGLDVDRLGNIYVGVRFGENVDLDADGTLEAAGFYVISLAADGRVRWHSRVDSIHPVSSIAIVGDGTTYAVGQRGEVGVYSAADGSLIDTITLEPFGRWPFISPGLKVARVGEEFVVAAILSDGANAATLLVRYDTSYREIGRRVIAPPAELADQYFAVQGVAGSRHYLAIRAHSSTTIGMGTGEIPAGHVVVVLNADLSTHRARAADNAFAIAVSDEGEEAAVGTSVRSFDAMGSELWTRDGGLGTHFRGVSYDGRGNVFVSGSFTGTMDVTPRGVLVADGGTCDAFFALWPVVGGDEFTRLARKIGGSGCESVHAVRVDPFGGMVVLGTFGGNVVLPFGTHSSEGDQDLFLVRYSSLD